MDNQMDKQKHQKRMLQNERQSIKPLLLSITQQKPLFSHVTIQRYKSLFLPIKKRVFVRVSVLKTSTLRGNLV